MPQVLQATPSICMGKLDTAVLSYAAMTDAALNTYYPFLPLLMRLQRADLGFEFALQQVDSESYADKEVTTPNHVVYIADAHDFAVKAEKIPLANTDTCGRYRSQGMPPTSAFVIQRL